MVILKPVELLLLKFSLIRVISVLPAEAWGHLIQPGHQGSVVTSGFGDFCWQHFLLEIDRCNTEMHSSSLQAEDGTVSVRCLKYPGLFGL